MVKAKKIFTQNDAVSLMLRDKAHSFRTVAKQIKEWEADCTYTTKDVIGLLMECADNFEAEAIVVDLRDQL